MGQNFLIDLNIHELIVEEARVGPDDVVLEVGPGAGALTALMAGRGAMIVAVELDPEMAKLTQEAVAGLPGVRVFNADALANKTHPQPGHDRKRQDGKWPRLRLEFSSWWLTCPTIWRRRSS